MLKLLFFYLVCSLAQAGVAEEQSDNIIYKKFIQTAFGVKSRTLDKKDAEAVLLEIQQFKIANPKAEIQIDILTCTSDFELPQNTITNKKIEEHLQLAVERNLMIQAELVKYLKVPVKTVTKICGPEFKKEDLNDRFVTKESNTFAEKYEQLKNTPGYQDQLRDEALIENPESVMDLYPTIFLAKFKPFQGIRLLIKGKFKEVEKVEKINSKPSSKTQ